MSAIVPCLALLRRPCPRHKAPARRREDGGFHGCGRVGIFLCSQDHRLGARRTGWKIGTFMAARVSEHRHKGAPLRWEEFGLTGAGAHKHSGTVARASTWV